MLIVTAALIEDGSKILIARRKAGKALAGFWEFPGGKLETKETPEACLRRELLEEFSIETEIKEFIGESIYHYPQFTIQLLAYRVKLVLGDFKLTDHDAIEWVTLDEIQNYTLSPADLPILESYRRLR